MGAKSMRERRAAAVAGILLLVGFCGVASAEAGAGADELSPESQRALIEDYCLMCHNDEAKTAGLSLESFDPANAVKDAQIAEKMIHKLRAGMMPPSFAPRPEPEEVGALAAALEARIDRAYFDAPKPGRRTFQRLNRAEYKQSVEDLLSLSVDVDALLPADTISHSFDNIADVQVMSPTLMDSYLRAADNVSRLAVGDPTAGPSEVTYKVPHTASQREHVDGAPFGTRGGISVVHNFPADGDYIFRTEMQPSPEGFLFGTTSKGEQIEVSINGARVALLDVDPLMSETDPNGLNIQTPPIAVKAGPQRVAAAFLKKDEAVIEDLVTPVEHTLADAQIGVDYGVTTVPHLRDLGIGGPYRVTGVSDSPPRRRIFVCRPTTAEEERPCAQKIVENLATRAYRRPLDETDVESLMSFYEIGREDGDFESGVRMALQAILTSPSFVFRLEEARPGVAAGTPYPITDLDLASRLSFFLWSSPPDDELLKLAEAGKLSDEDTLRSQVDRMLKDPRAETLATRFASLWLRLQDLDKLEPDAVRFPLYDATLARALKRETQLLFENLVKEDRSLFELLTADYSFVNERLAKHYEIPNVTGSEFRKVKLEGINSNRTGILGHGSILALTSVANRTSPVQRGKWVMEVLLGSPPPPPPPNVPLLEATSAVAGGKMLSVRQQMEAHRSNPACQSCHTVIDPIGLALENFDVTGAYRTRDRGVPIDASGELYDGTTLDGPKGLRDALLRHSDAFVITFTERLLTYALGRRVEYTDMPVVRKIAHDAARNDHHMSSFIMGVIDSVPFRMSTAEEGRPTETMDSH
jgi:mono/diheme cytochrome c family protein